MCQNHQVSTAPKQQAKWILSRFQLQGKSKRTRNNDEIMAMIDRVISQARQINEENVANRPLQLNDAPHQAHVYIQPIRLNTPVHRCQLVSWTNDGYEEVDC